MKLYLPEGSAFDEAGIYLRTGADESKSMDKDEIYINDIVAAYDFSRKGTTYNPPLGYSTDLKNLTRSNSKWANAVITKPTSGIYEAEAEIVVKDSAKQQSTLEIHYRGYAKTGGYQRAPADEELGRNESVATRQGLYANTKAIIASVGPSSICNEDFCSSLMMEDMGTKIRTYIIDEYSTEAMGHYKLLLGGIVKQSDGTVSNAELRISDESKGLRLEEYSIKTASGLKKSGNADSTKLAISVGDITKNSVIGGEADGTTSFVAFSPEKAGISKLKISLVSAEGEVVLEKIINVEVSPARELKINVVPKTIVPYIQNNLLIKVFSDDGVTDVEGASVSIIKNGTILDSGVTDSEGIFAYSLVSPEPGSSIRIEVEKTGYKSKALEVVVSENIIETEPSTIEVKFIIGRGHEIESEFVAKNLTLIPLTVESIELTADFRDYVEMSFDESIIGTVMDINSDINVTVLFTLKDKALELEKPKNIEGAIIVKVKNDELVKEWGSNVETIARIGFGDEVDSLDCLSVDPPIWDIIASDDSEKKTIMLVNNCTVDDDPIALTNLQVRIVGQEAETGVLEATSEDGGVGTIELTSVLQKLIGLVEENSENQITFEFTPDVSSGAEELEIEFVGMHYTSRGSEKIKAKVKADIAVSLLAECIQVKPTSMNITSTPYYTGYNNYGNQFSQGYNQYGASNSFDPYSTAAKMGYNYGSDGSNTGGSYSQGYGGYSSYGYNYQNSYPNQSSYANQNYYPQGTDYGSQGQNYAFNWQGAPGKLNIINNCAVDVEISLDHDEGLIPEERTFTVAPNETRELVIESGYAIGLYKIIVNAKAKDSLEAHQKIAEVNVNVESEAVKTYRDCISIDPPNTLKINSFMGKGSYIEVINQCYNEGIRLMENNSGINFPRDAAAYPADPVSDIKNIIGNWSYVSTDYDSTSDGKVVQKVTYRIIKSTKYVEDAPSFPDSGENPMQSIGGIRYFLTRGYYAINADTMMQVSFHTRTGEKKSISFPMTVEDLWQALDYAANTIKFGDPKYTPEQCVGDNINALTFSEYGDCIPYEELKNVFEKNIIKIARRDNRGDEVDGCGWMDRISEISKTTFENSGLQANLSLDEEGHSIKVRITGWEGKEYIPRTTISGETRITFKRAFYRTDKTKIPLKVSMTICEYGSKPGDDNGTTPITEVKCPEGETGSAVFKKYGFDKLQLDWKWNSITKDSCDTGMFCDAAQFGIALNKKMEKLNEIVDDVRPAKDSCTVADPSKCACAAPEQSSCANEFKNSKELFRWALESFKVFDDAAGKNLVFFRGTGEDLVVVDNDALDKIKEKVGTVTGSTDWTYILDTQTKLEAIKVLLDKESLLILLHTDKLTGYATEKGAFGIEQVKIGNTEYLVMTFNEYYEMHTRIKTVLAGMANKETETEVTVKTLSNADVKIEAAFLNEFNKARATVVIGILAKNDISTEDKETAMKEGVVKDGVDLQGYTNLLDLYKDLVEFDAYLIKDGYSADYRKDFTATYTQDIPKIGVDFNNWVFKVNGTENGALADAVLAGIAVDYDWSVQDKNALTIEIKKSKTLSEIQGSSNKYTMNALFQMPFDGELGYADKKREGYGTGYTAGGDIAENFFINYDNTTENLPLKSIANGLETTKASRSTTYDVSSSKILQINNKNLVFSPVDPIYIVANLSKTGSTEYAAGLVYYLKVGAKNYTGNSILNWKLGADTISGKSGILADAPMRVSTICEGQGNEELLGVAFNGKKSGNVSMNSIIYVPTAIDPANESQLIFSCIKDRLTATAKDVTAIKTTNLSGTSLGLNTDTKKGAIKVKEDYNLKKLADNINSEKVCVASDESGLGFYWNPAKVN